MKKVNLVGRIFGSLTVIEKGPNKEYENNIHYIQWSCKCECGKEILVTTSRLLSVKRPKTSCGCKNFTGDHGNRKVKDPKIVSIRALIKRYRNNAKFKEIPWLLTETEALKLFNDNCFYCGSIPSNTFNVYMTKAGKYLGNKEWANKAAILFNGIDRIDNALGYINTNTVSCCTTCNYAKHTLSIDEFYNWIERLSLHQGFIK